MRVLMVTPSYFPIKGGAEVVVKNLSTRLNEKGIETDVMTFNMDRKWQGHWAKEIREMDGLKVYRIPGFNWFPFSHSDRITMGMNLIPGCFKNYLKMYDMVHFHVGDFSFPLFSASVRLPKIAHFHGPLEFYKKNLPNREILKRIADFYIGITNGMCDDLTELGVPKDRIKYLPNAVDTELFKPDGPKEKNLVLFVGRISPSKGIHLLLDSLRLINVKIHLVIIGPCDWDIDYFDKIQRRIVSENRRGFHKVTFLGSQEQHVVAHWCKKASLLALPSFREAFGVAILEALSSETPVIGTDIPGIREVIESGKNGFLVPTNDSKEIASSITRLIENDKMRTEFGRDGRQTVLKKYSYNVTIDRLCEIYREIL
jgi:glycosyltransferase involved in cell wall biosynthesis